MNFKSAAFALVCSTAFACAPAAQAATRNWTISAATFNDGGTLTGTFSTDADTGALTAFDLTTTGGTLRGGFHYDGTNSVKFFDNFFSTNSFVIMFNIPSGSPYINLAFDAALTSATSTAYLRTGGYAADGSWECDNCSNLRNITGGYVTAVPEPASYGMLLAGLGLISYAATRRKQNGQP